MKKRKIKPVNFHVKLSECINEIYNHTCRSLLEDKAKKCRISEDHDSDFDLEVLGKLVYLIKGREHA